MDKNVYSSQEQAGTTNVYLILTAYVYPLKTLIHVHK